MLRWCIIVIFCMASLLTVNAQDFHTSSNRALKSYTEGKRAYDFVQYELAEQKLRDAIKIDPEFLEAHLILAELYKDKKKYDSSIKSYLKVFEIDSLFFKPAIFSLAEVYFLNGEYGEALKYFNSFLNKSPVSDKLIQRAGKYLDDCNFALEAVKNPVPFHPRSLGDSINTDYDEYWPSISVDDKLLIFTRQTSQSAKSLSGIRYQEDFYYSSRPDSVWLKARNIGTPLNTADNEGALSLSAGGQSMYFTACNRPDGLGGCDIYYSSRTDKGWLQGSNIGAPLNSASWESQPSLSSDGRSLYFVSNRKGGFGGMDLWVSYYTDSGSWSEPVNLGRDINTAGDEMSPYIHFDGKTLYFSSNGRPSMGGFDIFMANKISDTIWTGIRNLGYPINTQTDEIGLIINSSGNTAYFSSAIKPGSGRDLYSFDLPEELRPNPVSYFKGTVLDAKTRRRLQATYELVNLKTNEVVLSSSTNGKGEFLICLSAGENYGLNVDLDAYLFYSENFWLESNHSAAEPFLKTIELSRVKVGEAMNLYNILFETDSWEIKEASLAELHRLKNKLLANPKVIIEIGGHTDATGSVEYNDILSKKRADAVGAFLISEGVSESRIRSKGFGKSRPVSDNNTEEGRRKNRRTEILIVDILE